MFPYQYMLLIRFRLIHGSIHMDVNGPKLTKFQNKIVWMFDTWFMIHDCTSLVPGCKVQREELSIYPVMREPVLDWALLCSWEWAPKSEPEWLVTQQLSKKPRAQNISCLPTPWPSRIGWDVQLCRLVNALLMGLLLLHDLITELFIPIISTAKGSWKALASCLTGDALSKWCIKEFMNCAWARQKGRGILWQRPHLSEWRL